MDVERIIDLGGGAAEFAKRLGVARTTVLDWRKDGLIPGSRVGSISQLLDIPADQLVKLTYPPRGKRSA